MAVYPKIELNDGYYIETWYNRHERSWVSVLKDKNGTQIGDAQYDGTRESVSFSRQMLERLAVKMIAEKL